MTTDYSVDRKGDIWTIASSGGHSDF
jgi:hypothetical protein